MSTELKDLVQLNKSHIKPAVEVLVKAFQNYPLLQYYFPDELERRKIAPSFLSFAVFNGVQYGETYATSRNLEGVAVWLPPDNYPVTFWRLVRSVPADRQRKWDTSSIEVNGHFGACSCSSVSEKGLRR
jgi:hypothetical protein